MKNNMRFVLAVFCCLLSTVLLGCSTVKEIGKGFIGKSTKVLEAKRSDALKKSFTLGYNDCYQKVKDILVLQDVDAPYIYFEDSRKKMIAIYLSQTDTTPVGIFFTAEGKNNTLIEISSPSVYAKEEVANRIFGGLTTKPQSQKENNADVKEKTSN